MSAAAPPTVLIFGATGGVGSATARAAQSLGAKVVLAVRDLQKPIPGLGADEEKTGGFERVQADFTNPDSIEDAVRTSVAKHAFVYFIHGSKDAMRPSLEALKAAGIEFVVFLSSASVRGDLTKIPPAEFIPFMHAQVELALRDIFGVEGYVAVRPAYFNTNSRWWASMIREGEVRMVYPEHKLDWISPKDIGKVAGQVLVKGIAATEGLESRNSIFLMGPKFITQRDAAKIIGRAAGKDVKVTEIDEDEGAALMAKNGVPEPVARKLVQKTGQRFRGEINDMYDDKTYKEAVVNLNKFTGNPSSLEEWAEENKSMFS
ncbi:NAD(P)-binding protein [Hypoxylon crocopeplum]|nr:NAD(P)-binding protein [Hypoxylon crocopeplum]